ncbi:E3 ubiquitin-protein ligase UPL2-like [Bidens hawaiensis]|uniref:E3 ubiquitin-protein ligase UPL2-like n=1 Tax=Bidens hawaiensis TaxID=980011 RepID=UPI004049EAEC
MAAAASLRSNLPSRPRQLISGTEANNSSSSDTPLKVKAFIDKVIQCPLQDIEIPLSGFRWEYNKGNFHHWRPLFLHFDTYFKTYVSTRKDLLLTDDIVEDDTPFPKQSVLQILRVMQIILDNCPNRSAFTGLEHFKLLLASTDPEVLIATLETLSSLVKMVSPKPHSSGKLVGCGSINSSLLSLAQGWGSKEEGLGLYSCVVSNEKTPDDSLSLFPSIDDDKSQSRMRSTLYFELHGTYTQDMGASASVIHIPDLHTREEDDLSIMKQLVEQYNVGPEHWFLLLTRIRYAHAFRSPKMSRLYSKICLLAFIVLVQSGDSHDELVSFFANEPEYTNELVRLVKSEETISLAIRMLAVQALGAQLVVYSSSHERARILNTGCNRVQLINVLQREISSLNKSTDTPSIAYIEALLHFHVLQVITTSSPRNIIRGPGMVSTFLPLIDDTEPAHMNLVLLAVKILQKLMDYSNSAVTLLQDLGGVDLLTNRLHTEVVKMINSMKIGESSDTIDDQTFPHMLIRILLKALSSATYASANTTRPQNPQNNSLPATLMLIFKNMVTFGGDIYSAAVQVMCEMIHKDPTCYASLDEIGLPSAFISSVAAGVLPSTRALTCVPNGLGAICLNTKGLEEVKEKSALRFLVDVFTHEKYALPMNDAIVPLANAVEELLRHVTSLRVTGVDLIIEIINKIALIEDSKGAEQSGKVTGSNVTDMDTEEKEKSTLEGVSNEPFIQSCIFHVMVLVHRTMENAETCRIFVEKSGIEALLKLLLRPSITQSSKGMSIALHSTMVFKSFTQHHSAPLASAFCSSLRDYLKSTLTGFDLLTGSFLLDPKSTPDAKVISSLFLVEFLLFLAASKDNRWIAGLLQEFGNGSKDVLEDIGRIHREILWQLALLEDAKFEKNEDVSDSSADVSRSSESEQQRFDSFRQFLDPLMRRRMSGLSFDSQFFDLINLYHDLTHPSSTHGPPEPHTGAGHRSTPSGTSDMMRLLSLHITHLFQELGKAMLLPSRRRDELVTGTPSGSVASTFASITLDHMNFEGREASWSAKCRYLGKVVDFIDDILLEKSDSCNPMLLNCLYGRGVIKSVLTTFEATSELLFTVSKTPASPMETDEGILKQTDTEEMNHSWINDSLANYGKLMNHLVTSSFILSSSSKHLLTQPLVNGGNIPLPRDPEVFVRVLQSMILKTVLPLWTHPRFVDCNDDFITTVISIIRNVFSGVEVKNVSNGGSRLAAPLSETTISTIVEMGFTRPHAEEALRQIGSNSVELAMEWLFSHPEQVPEDDELSRALAMSLGNNSSDKSLGNNSSDAKENTANETSKQIEEETVQLPPVHELLSTCKKLLQVKDSLAFSVRDLFLICLQDDGQYRSNVLTFIVDQIADNGKNTMMISSLFHVLALLLNDDNDLREVASKSGLVKAAADRLSNWNPENDNSKTVPKWVTPAFLAVDRLAQVDQKLNADIISELLKKDDVGNQTHIVIDDEKQNKVQPYLGLIDIEDQKRFVEISCHYLKNSLPAETVHAVLQLCSTLTRNHFVALSFLNAGGLPLLLSLPSNSLFVGFDNVAANIIRHILEDPQTLQQAMESEIKQSVVAAVNRQSTSRLTPRSFLLNLTSVISRDPVVFMRAAQSVCQIEMDGDRPCIVLLKGKSKEKEKTETMADGKPPEANVKHVKVHRKPPQSFVSVIELLLDSVMNFVPPVKDEPVAVSGEKSSLTDMDIDLISNKGKGKENESENGEQEQHASIAKVVFILKLLTETLMIYGPSVHVLLRRDGEIAHKGPSSTCAGGVFHHILHQFLPYSKSSKKEKKTDVDWRHKLADRASKFLVAACVRSTEARKRIFGEINNVFTDFVSSSVVPQPPGDDIQAFVDLLSGVLLARSPTGSSISSEVSVSFIDVGLIRSLTQLLQVMDLDHPDSLKVAPGLMKVLEVVTKEHVLAAEANAGKGDNTIKSLDHTENEQTENIGIESREIEPATDDMEHDQENDGSFVPPSEDDYMHETSDNTRVVENGFDSVGITFEIQPDSQESLDEDDEDMSGDERDEDEEEEEEEEDGDEEENNDLEDEVHHLPHLDTDQDDNEIDEDDFDEDMNEEEDDDDEDEDDGDGGGRVILGLSEEMNGINVLDHIEVLGRDNGFPNDTFHMMPVEVFGSRRQGRTTSIYNILGRSPDTSAPAQHPLLVDPSGQAGQVRDRNLESTSSRLDAVFRSLRNGRRGDRPSMWANDGQSGGSNPSSIPSGFEELLVSHLRPPTPVNPPDHETGIEGQTQDETAQLQASAGMVPEPTTENDGNSEPTINELQTSIRHPQSVEMQSDHNSVDGVSQESSENEATLGESLRSLDVETRSLDVETGSTNASLVNTITTSASGSLHSVPEASENHGQESEQGAAAAPAHDARIDPTFLDALPDELRAEVLSGQPGPVTQVINTEPQNGGVNDIDPEFLAALPPDIRAEVLAQQQAQVAQRSHELEGQPVEMDTVSIIATFPSEIREEVLLTSSDDVLSNLTPALVAEANMLRERFRRNNRTLFGMFPRNRRGESSRRGEGIGSSLDRISGAITHRSTGSHPIETDGAPLVDTKDLKALTRLLRVVQPIYRPHLQRLLLNLCAHAETRSALIKILMDLLVLDTRTPNSDLNASEPSYRLYASQSHLMYSRPQSFDGVPPLLSRRVLETLTYLARNHKFVAKLMLQFRIQTSDQARGKAVMNVQDDVPDKHQYQDGLLAITLLLSLLKQPLYLRSIAHLEQLLNLLDVIIDNAESTQVLVQNEESVAEESAQMSTLDGETKSDAKSSKIDDAPKPSSSGVKTENESHNILLNLPQAELRLLCSLFASESLSESAYALVADILKKLVAIAPHHCHLFITELAGSMKNLTKLAINELRVFGETEKALINASGSNGAAILRVIQALSSLVTSLNQEKEQTVLENEQAATISLVNAINADLELLWVELSTCISKIESFTDTTPEESSSSINLTSRPSGAFPPLPSGTQNILPHIESFFVMCEKLHFGHDSDDAGVPGTSVKAEEKNAAFVKFADKHRKLLNGFIRQNPGLLEKSFLVMLKVPRFIDFDNKRSYFRSKIKHQHDHHHHHSGLRISVRRAYILEDSYNQLRMRSTQDLKGRLTVHFQGEEGIDGGGLTREWYQLLSRVIFDKGALLFTTVGNESTFQPNPNSVFQTEHLSYFKFVGRVVGKALFDGQLLDVHFTRSFYKHMLGAKVTYHDIEAIDPGYFKNLKWMLENDISDILDLTFSIDADEEKLILFEKAEVTDHELIPGGRNIRVTEENKHEYVNLIAEHRLTTAIRPQINAFLEGFNELIPRDNISIFHDKELELLISGLPDIDLDDMRANTEYSGYSAASPVIHWFWEVAQALSKEDKARLLQFVTGTSKVPLEGFSALQGISGAQKFQIHKAYGSSDRLPSAHTCFNQLDLPEYPSKQHLEERLLLAIHEANEGFGFG